MLLQGGNAYACSDIQYAYEGSAKIGITLPAQHRLEVWAKSIEAVERRE